MDSLIKEAVKSRGDTVETTIVDRWSDIDMPGTYSHATNPVRAVWFEEVDNGVVCHTRYRRRWMANCAGGLEIKVWPSLADAIRYIEVDRLRYWEW
jgi:hypothetical protein